MQTVHKSSNLVNRAALNEVGTMIGRQLLFKKPVGVCFEADVVSRDSLGNFYLNTYLTTIPPFNARRILTNSSDLGPLMGYPDILRKQWMHNETSARNEEILSNILQLPIDIVRQIYSFNATEPPGCDIKINPLYSHDFPWYFGNADIPRTYNDFRLLAAREITRGLGFKSHTTLVEKGELIRAYPLDFYKSGHTSIFAARSPVDDLLHGSVPPKFQDIMQGNNLIGDARRDYPISAIFDKLEKLGLYKMKFPYYQYDNLKFGLRLRFTLWQLSVIMREPVVAKFDDGSQMTILFERYGKLSTNSTDGAEFLMSTQAAASGVSLRQLMQHYNVENVYGPKMLKIFEALGYSTLSKPEVVQFAPDIPKKSRNPFSFLKKKNTY